MSVAINVKKSLKMNDIKIYGFANITTAIYNDAYQSFIEGAKETFCIISTFQ